jgi:hypothetical protein
MCSSFSAGTPSLRAGHCGLNNHETQEAHENSRTLTHHSWTEWFLPPATTDKHGFLSSFIPRLDFEADLWLIDRAMNTSLVKSMPQGDFAEISVLMKGWETRFQTLVSQNRAIKYDMYPQPGIPQEFQSRLEQHGYSDLILANDQWQHFLIPNSRQAALGARQMKC